MTLRERMARRYVYADQAGRVLRDHGAVSELAPAARRRDQGQQPVRQPGQRSVNSPGARRLPAREEQLVQGPSPLAAARPGRDAR